MVIAVGAIGTALLCLAARVYVSQLAYVAAILPAAVVISVLPNIWAHPAQHTVVDPLLLMFTTMTFIAGATVAAAGRYVALMSARRRDASVGKSGISSPNRQAEN
jgi:hypothetical protein